jgi:small-conductance mechanosensitive channel
MNTASQTQSVTDDLQHLVFEPNAIRSVIILLVALIAAFFLSRLIARIIVKIAQVIAVHSDNESNEIRQARLRQTETYLSITIAIVRFFVVVIVGLIAWRALSPFGRDGAINSVAAIGAGTVFVVIAGQTVGIILRDLTAGSIMITEGWYKIGDFVKLEPFMEVSGVVERFTLRSTKIRALSGEAIWVHNQYIQAAHITPRGVRTIAVDVFVRDKDAGMAAIKKIISAIPKGKTMLAQPMNITSTEEWGENRWRITVTGQTAPGREWLIEKFFVEAVNDLDDGKVGSDKLIALPPMPRYADEVADRQFKRAVRIKENEPDEEV